MDRVNRIIHHPKYMDYVHRIALHEKDRIFCKHNMEHFLNVARIGMIINLESNNHIDKEWIYAAGLLHDIGRFREYEIGLDHAEESARLSTEILREVGFTEDEIDIIVVAISEHRTKDQQTNELSKVLYKADKSSRECIWCSAFEQCKKFEGMDRRDLQLKY